ncbi:MAG TPA: YggS family pyridoxal phosphate-dependent enzyme [Fimbriimonadaceae bacterium]|nr:YggS family pyridoxal phosphate-dependent enzyme [Fimbriimonadaceae bacterium]
MKRRLASIRERMARACDSVGRDPDSVTLVAVSKTHPADAIREAYDLGLREFGESRVQEAIPKIESLPNDIVWHFVGHLQSNKAKKAGQYFDVIHTLDSADQLKELQKANRRIDALIEVNIAKEPQKHGIFAERLDDFRKEVIHYQQVHFRGLMTIGPALGEQEKMRPFFKSLRLLNERIGGDWLSMGMSGDFEVAIQEGSTHIRVGTALFGERS